MPCRILTRERAQSDPFIKARAYKSVEVCPFTQALP